jgi:hypothetical protein
MSRPSVAGRLSAMNWFRSNIKHGAQMAFFALLVQFVLSFGHFHGVAAPAVTAIQSGALAASQPVPGHDSSHHPDDICAICMVMAMANTVLFATPLVLPSPQVLEFSYLTTYTGFTYLDSIHLAFQPRAPPIS